MVIICCKHSSPLSFPAVPSPTYHLPTSPTPFYSSFLYVHKGQALLCVSTKHGMSSCSKSKHLLFLETEQYHSVKGIGFQEKAIIARRATAPFARSSTSSESYTTMTCMLESLVWSQVCSLVSGLDSVSS